MIKESRDEDLLIKATDCCRDLLCVSDIKKVLAKPDNFLLVDGDNVALVIFDYPGVYTVHWYYSVRGRQAIALGKEMLSFLFDNYYVRTIRGLIKRRLRASRWAARQVGLKSLGFIMFPNDDENEFFYYTLEDHNNMKDKK